MAKLSLCMIVKNEHATLARCLDSIRPAVDEIIIVDTGSDDDTRSIAEKYTPQVFDFEWQDDFSAARNFSFARAHGDYIMWMDADDVISPQECARLKAYKNVLDEKRPDVVMLKYALAFDEKGRCTFWNHRERLLRRECGFVWQGAVHEVITPAGNVEYSDITIEHRPLPETRADPAHSGRNLRIYEKLAAAGTLSARDCYYFARELFYHARYADAIVRLEEFLARPDGWIEDRYAACMLMGRCHAGLNDRSSELQAYIRAFDIDAPRAGLCCALGHWYADAANWKAAEFWFRTALQRPRPQQGFVDEDEYTYTPYIWLCVCLDRQGDHAHAFVFNELARAIKPHERAVLYNAEYFEKLGFSAKPENDAAMRQSS